MLSYTDNYLRSDTDRTGLSWLLIMAELQGLSANELITKSSSWWKLEKVRLRNTATMSHTANVLLGGCFFQRCCEHHDCVLFNGFGCWEDMGNTNKQTSKYHKKQTLWKYMYLFDLDFFFFYTWSSVYLSWGVLLCLWTLSYIVFCGSGGSFLKSLDYLSLRLSV